MPIHSSESNDFDFWYMIDGVKASLTRLQLDHIDLYQVHGFDVATPIEETLRALDQLVRHGHVRYIGVSNWAAIFKVCATEQRSSVPQQFL